MKKANRTAAELGISAQKLKKAPDRYRKILEHVAGVMRWLRSDHPDLLPLYYKFLKLAMKGSLKASTAAARRLRAEITRRQAA
jgi:hypothetical protein